MQDVFAQIRTLEHTVGTEHREIITELLAEHLTRYHCSTLSHFGSLMFNIMEYGDTGNQLIQFAICQSVTLLGHHTHTEEIIQYFICKDWICNIFLIRLHILFKRLHTSPTNYLKISWFANFQTNLLKHRTSMQSHTLTTEAQSAFIKISVITQSRFTT